MRGTAHPIFLYFPLLGAEIWGGPDWPAQPGRIDQHMAGLTRPQKQLQPLLHTELQRS